MLRAENFECGKVEPPEWSAIGEICSWAKQIKENESEIFSRPEGGEGGGGWRVL